jgi:hypothetical protein
MLKTITTKGELTIPSANYDPLPLLRRVCIGNPKNGNKE